MAVCRSLPSPSSSPPSSSWSAWSSSDPNHLTQHMVRSEVRGQGTLTSVEGECLWGYNWGSKVKFTECELTGDR